MRAAGYQAKTVCGNLQLCTGLESGIEGETHSVAQRRMERSVERSRKEEAERSEEEGDEVEEAIEEGMTVEIYGTEEEAAEILDSALGMKVDLEGEVYE